MAAGRWSSWSLVQLKGDSALASRTLFLGPLLMGLISFAVLVWPSQSREVYLRLVDEPDWVQRTAGLLSIMALATCLFVWNARLALFRMRAVFYEHGDLSRDRMLDEIRWLKAAVCAGLPMAGVLAGLLSVRTDIGTALIHVRDGLRATATAQASELLEALERLPDQMLAATLLVALITAGTLLVLRRLLRLAPGAIVRLDRLFIVLGWLVALAPLAGEVETVEAARFLGPMCVGSLALVAVAAGVRALYWLFVLIGGWLVFCLVQLGRLPERTVRRLLLTPDALVGYVLAACAITGGTIAVFLWHVSSKSDNPFLQPARPELAHGAVEKEFKDWLAARKVTPGSSGPAIPVYIIAAQGGGLYAATATMTLLAALEDRCPQFARHTFAISAVSGGAIGASVFASMAANIAPDPAARCDLAGKPGELALTNAAARVAADDHLSPLTANLPTDLLLKLNLLFGAREDALRAPECQSGPVAFGRLLRNDLRADALRCGFVHSAEAAKAGAMSQLQGPSSAGWRPQGTRPALLLNTTSVETGLQVAFSPFPLSGTGDHTLLSFTDLAQERRRFAALTPMSQKAVTEMAQIDAAVTSARFPFVLPSWLLWHELDRKASARLNFVDGGYTDASGATTAVAVFESLKQYIAKEKLTERVRLRLLLINNSDARIGLATSQGSRLRDLAAPIAALLSVRSLHAGLGATRADLAASGTGELLRVELDHRVFPLPFGWLLSRPSLRLIETMIGASDRCPRNQPSQEDTELRFPASPLRPFQRLVASNSCTQKSIINEIRVSMGLTAIP